MGRTPTAKTALIAGMADGSYLTRKGDPYKPATRRSYERALTADVLPALGAKRLSAVKRRDVQTLVDALRTSGLKPSTVHNRLDPLRVIFRRAIRDDLMNIDPTEGLELPRVSNGRTRVESTTSATALLDALPDGERALFTMALFAGIRSGELRALRVSDVDIKGGVVRIERGWDDEEGEQDPKSYAARRTVPLAGRVRREIAAHLLREGRSGNDLVFGRTADLAFYRSTVRSRMHKAWKKAGLTPLAPHEARHCAASYLIAAGVNAKQLSVYIGHSDIRTTFNLYGHLLPGDEADAAAKLDALLGEVQTA